MEKKSSIDAFGAFALSGFAVVLAFNQVVIKVTNGGLQPVFFAGLRSLGAVLLVYLWLRYRKIPIQLPKGTLIWGLLIGTAFAVEFIFLFVALDLTTVSRASVLFYSMPLWLALMSHFALPNDRLSAVKAIGLGLALLGVFVAFMDRQGGEASVIGDLLAIAGAISWAVLALIAKASPLSKVRPELQLFCQITVSAPILLVASLFFGEFVRDLQPIHLWGLAFQIVVVVTAGFLFWLWLLSIYPASGVASFSFLSPVLAVGFGWLLLDETVGLNLLAALVLVAVGIVLINRPAKSRKTSG